MEFRWVERALAAWDRDSDEIRASSDSQDEGATCGRRGAAATLHFSSGLSAPTMRAVRFLGRSVEFPDCPDL